LTASTLTAQVYQKTWQQRYENEPTAMVLTENNNVWVVSKHGVIDLLYDADATSTKLDFLGNIEFVINHEILEETTISDLYVLPNDGVLFRGYGKKCPNQVNGFVGRLMADGQQLCYDALYFTPCLKIRMASDTSIYLFFSDRIETRLWDNGTVLETVGIEVSMQNWFVDFLYWEAENWFILASGPVLYIIEPDVQWGPYGFTPNDTIHIVSMEFLTNNSLLLHTSNGFIYNCC